MGDDGPCTYTHIKANCAVGNALTYVFPHTKCSCKPEDPSPCGYGSDCVNRSMFVECHPRFCQAGRSCNNQLFQKRVYADVAPFRKGYRDWALKACKDIQSGTFVMEYVGEIIDYSEAQRRLLEKHEQKCCVLPLDDDRYIDAGSKGNLSRFMQHSSERNCMLKRWMVDGDYRIGIFTNCDIPSEMELTFDPTLDSVLMKDNQRRYSKRRCVRFASNYRCSVSEKPATVSNKA